MPNLSVAIIGCEQIAHLHAWSHMENLEIAAVCDASASIAAATAEHFPGSSVHTEVLPMLASQKFDIVDVCLPAHLQYEVCAAALIAGSNVLCTVPFTGSVDKAQALVDLSQRSGKLLLPSFSLRFHSLIHQMLEMLEEDDFGRVSLFRCRLAAAYPKDSPPSGAMLNTALHGVDLYRACCGEVMLSNRIALVADPVHSVDDVAVVSMHNEWSAGVVEALWSDIDTESSIELTGTVGACKIDLVADTMRSITATWDTWRRAQGSSETPTEGLFMHVINILLRGEKPALTADDGVKALQLCLG